MKILFAAAALGLSAPVAHADCAPLRDMSEPSARLILELREAESEREARQIGAELWQIWLTAPDTAAQALLDEGIERLRVADHERAEAAFSELIEYCPDYAEGYNQRAFSAYLRGDYGAALDDLDLALDRTPTHVGALSGKALTLMGLGRIDAGQAVLREALALNPWLSERRLLIEKPGEDL